MFDKSKKYHFLDAHNKIGLDFWSKQLGLLPIYLFPNQDNDIGQFIMLNGQNNNFCLDYESSFDSERYKSLAWSAGVDNFIVLGSDKLFLHRWYKNSPEEVNIHVIEKNIDKFYEYLGQGNKSKENAIIPFIIRIFHKLRNTVGQEGGGAALKAFLYLLAASKESIVNIEEWGLPKESKEIISNLNQNHWEQITEEFKMGLKSDNLIPETNLILRHCGGKLFEEAHFAAFLNTQMTLFGPSDGITFKSNSPQQFGAYFTPSFIARSLVEEILRDFRTLPDELTIFDPSCGSSEFLVEALRQLKKKTYKGKIKIIGWDISDSAIDISKFILQFEIREWSNNVSIDLKQCDSLLQKWPENVDILLMNPPFKSWELMGSDTNLRDSIKNILGDKYSKNPNLAAAFLWRAVECLASNGRIGCLLPSAILNSDSHALLRIEIAERITPLIIGRLGSFVFQNALVDACFMVAKKTLEKTTTTILWTKNVVDVTSKALRQLRRLQYDPNKIIDEKEQYSIYKQYADYSKLRNWAPVSYLSSNLKLKLEQLVQWNALSRVKEIFAVHRGIDPGRKYFKVQKSYYNSFKAGEKNYFRPCADGSSIQDGRLILKYYIFYPNSVGLKPINSEKDLEKYTPTFYHDILLKNKNDLKQRTLSKPKEWWLLQRHRPWQEERFPKLISGAFGKSGDFAFDDQGDFVVEQSCAWLFKDEKANPKLNYAYLAIFCSGFWNLLLTVYSKQLAGGEWYNLQTKHVNEIPLPNFANNTIDPEILNHLTSIGKRIHLGKAYSLEELDEFTKKVYQVD